MSGARRVTEVPPGLPSGAAADLVEEVLLLGGRETRLLRPRSGDALLDEVLAEDDPADDRLPFWAELWPSGSALAAAVAAAPLAGTREVLLAVQARGGRRTGRRRPRFPAQNRSGRRDVVVARALSRRGRAAATRAVTRPRARDAARRDVR